MSGRTASTTPAVMLPGEPCSLNRRREIGAWSVIASRSVDHRNPGGGPHHGNPSRGRPRGGQAADHRDRHPRGTEGRRGAGRDQGHRHLSHRRVHPLRRRSGGTLPRHPRTRGRGRRRRGRRGRHQRQAGRSRHPALHPGMPPVRLLPERKDQPLPGHPRDPGARGDARRHQPVQHGQGLDLPLHGHVDVRQPHGAAGDRGGEGARGRAVRQDLLHRVRRDHRHRGGDQHRQGRAGGELRGVRPRRDRAQRHPGSAPGGRRHHRRRRPQPRQARAGGAVRDDSLRQSGRGRGRPRAVSRGHHQGRRGLLVRVHRQRRRHAPGAGVLPQGLGREHHHRRRRGRAGDRPPVRSSS